MKDWSGPWTNVGRDWEGDPLEWCGHQHATMDEANECSWAPEGEALVIHIVQHFNPEEHAPCVHLNHPAECERCRAYANQTQELLPELPV